MPGADRQDAFEALTARLDERIRAGEPQAVRDFLERFRRQRYSRPQILQLAQLARRAELPEMGLRLLFPVIHPPHRRPLEATPEERAEYAASLAYLGAAEEALGILEALDAQKIPQVWLFRVWALVTRWEYHKTIPLLEAYLGHPGVGEYPRLVAKVNLVAALHAEKRLDRAAELLEELRPATLAADRRLLRGNVLELSAQNAILQGDWGRGEAFLDEAEAQLSGTGGLYRLFVAKWRAISAWLRDPRDPHRLLGPIREQALKHRHWETLRECDRFQLQGRFDESLYRYLLFGTAHPAYRKMLERWIECAPELPPHHTWWLGKPEGGPVIRLSEGEVEGKKAASLKPGTVGHRLLVCLSSDFYRGFRLPEIYSRVYPDAHYNPVTAKNQLHQALVTLRAWFRKARLPLDVECGPDGGYRLTGKAGIELTFHRNAGAGSLLDRLESRCGDKPFRAKEAAALMEVSPMTALRVLHRGVESGRIRKTGSGSATRYERVGRDRPAPGQPPSKKRTASGL